MLKRFDAVTSQTELLSLSRTAKDLASFDALIKKEYEAAQAQAQLAIEVQVADENTAKAVQAQVNRRIAAERRAQELRERIQAKQQARTSATAEGYQKFLARVGTLHKELCLRKAVLSQAATYTPHDLRYATTVETAYQYVRSWVADSDAFSHELADLEAQLVALQDHGADAGSLRDIRDLLTDVQTLYQSTVSDVSREHARRESYADSVADFLRSQGQLVHWCRNQRNVLESVTDSEQVQELCTSFQNNIAVMETNLLVLLELSEPLAPNPTVRTALIEVNEVWLSLSVYAFERMRDSLLAQHAESGIQLATRRWLNELNEPLRKFLEDAQNLLKMPNDPDSRSVTLPALDQCTALLEDFAAHSVIMEHLGDYMTREEILTQHYNVIRRAVFSKLTLLTLSFHGQVQYPRRQEYNDRLAELTDWVQSKSQSGAWKQLLARVERMKQLIEENEALHGTAEDRVA